MHAVIALVIFVGLVILSAQKMVTDGRNRKLAAAKVPSKITGHSEMKTGETLINLVGGIRLAFDQLTGELMRVAKKDSQHGLVAGPTGCGKGVWMTGAILDLAGRASIIYVDAKANTTAVCGRYLAEKGKLIVCNPYENQKDLFPKNIKLPASTPYNPLARLSPDQYGYTAECERIAELFPDNVSGGNENAMHFKYRATDLIAGVIMDVCEFYPP